MKHRSQLSQVRFLQQCRRLQSNLDSVKGIAMYQFRTFSCVCNTAGLLVAFKDMTTNIILQRRGGVAAADLMVSVPALVRGRQRSGCGRHGDGGNGGL